MRTGSSHKSSSLASHNPKKEQCAEKWVGIVWDGNRRPRRVGPQDGQVTWGQGVLDFDLRKVRGDEGTNPQNFGLVGASDEQTRTGDRRHIGGEETGGVRKDGGAHAHRRKRKNG